VRTFFFAMAIAAVAVLYYNKEIKHQLQMWSSGSNSYQYSGKSVTHGMASFGSSLGNSFESMGKGISGN
jgi:hypothetical protein